MDFESFKDQRKTILASLKKDPTNEELKKILEDLDEILGQTQSGEDEDEEEEEEEDMFSDPTPKKKKQKRELNSSEKELINIPELSVEVQHADSYRILTSFEDLGKSLDNTLAKNLQSNGFIKPTPIQKHSIPILLENRRDILACAQTGSGKTISFLVPIIAALLSDFKEGKIKRPMSYHKHFPLALILAPTRELVIQIQVEAEKLMYDTFFKSIALYGGVNKQQQKVDLVDGCDVVIATPGRLVDLIQSQKIGLSCLSFFVMDEADRMLDMGFEKDIKKITSSEGFPKKEDKKMQTVLFSATFPKEIRRLAEEFLNQYVFLRIGTGAVATIHQSFKYLDPSEKQAEIVKELLEENGLILVFAETKKSTDDLAWFLHEKKFKCTAIHGNLNQKEREEALSTFKSGKTPILVATDVAG